MSPSAVTVDEFAALMAPLGPFPAAPTVAVAVSGGADSMALALLADGWARGRGGRVTAITVDHRLRPGSSAEAAQVGAWLAGRGIDHVVLAWEGAKPASDLQAAARAARHGLMGAYCAAHGILHLLLAHHQDDQAETLMLRLGRGSGLHGLSAMAAFQPTRWGALLRPLLDIPRARLAATLQDQEQGWIEDPSNANPAFARVRLRRLLPALAAEGMTPERLCATAFRLGRARHALERQVARAALDHAALFPMGHARLERALFKAESEEVGLRLLAGLLAVTGGGDYVPRAERLDRLYRDLGDGLVGARTLAGCKLVAKAGDSAIIICREPARMAPPVALVPGAEVVWDGRFRARLDPRGPTGLRLGGLGASGWRKLAARAGSGGLFPVPACARATIPVVWSEDGVFAAPVLGYNPWDAMRVPVQVVPACAQSLTAAGLRLV